MIKVGLAFEASLSFKSDPLVFVVLPKLPRGEPDYMTKTGKEFAKEFGCKFLELTQNDEGLVCWRLEISEEQAIVIDKHPKVEEALIDFENPQVRGWYHRVVDAVKAPFSRYNV